MNPKRRSRLYAVVFVLIGTAATVGVALLALRENIDAFYAPDRIVAGEAPTGVRIRAGGMVMPGSVARAEDSLEIRFVLTDHAGSDFLVRFNGILPDLFREGQGILATGELNPDGTFSASEVLAKHDENYMPPELAGMATMPAVASTGTATGSAPGPSSPGMAAPTPTGLAPGTPSGAAGVATDGR